MITTVDKTYTLKLTQQALYVMAGVLQSACMLEDEFCIEHIETIKEIVSSLEEVCK